MGSGIGFALPTAPLLLYQNRVSLFIEKENWNSYFFSQTYKNKQQKLADYIHQYIYIIFVNCHS